MSAMQSTVLVETPTTVSSLKQNRLIRQAFIINILIFSLVILANYNETVALMGCIVLVLYFSVKSFLSPIKTFFLIFGVKLTFDTLWFIKIPVYKSYGVLHLLFIPVLILMIFGTKMPKNSPRWPILYAFVYLLWVSLSMISNGIDFDIEILLRQSGIFIGLLLGCRYLKDAEDFNLLAYLVFISTIIPVLASILQFFVGLESTLFHYKLDSIREYRYSGLYYDAATTGMVNILSLGSNLYLLYFGAVKKRFIKYHIAFIPLSLLVIYSGGTRSIILTSSFMLLIFLIRNLRKSLKIVPLILIVLFFSQSYIEKVVKRSAYEIQKKVEVGQILQETEYRPIFTGRVGIWQDIWDEFSAGSYLQQLFGSGLTSNAHSSYFFLLLQIGWVGLLYYLIFHMFLFMVIFRKQIPGTQKVVALLSLSSILMVGFSASTVAYTSFQWIIYLIVGGALNMGINLQRVESKSTVGRTIRW